MNRSRTGTALSAGEDQTACGWKDNFQLKRVSRGRQALNRIYPARRLFHPLISGGSGLLLDHGSGSPARRTCMTELTMTRVTQFRRFGVGRAARRDRQQESTCTNSRPERTKQWETCSGPSHNLPVSLSSFIRGEHAQARVHELLTAHRMVTLVGAGGVRRPGLPSRSQMESSATTLTACG
jgi:hypothetical protein